MGPGEVVFCFSDKDPACAAEHSCGTLPWPWIAPKSPMAVKDGSESVVTQSHMTAHTPLFVTAPETLIKPGGGRETGPLGAWRSPLCLVTVKGTLEPHGNLWGSSWEEAQVEKGHSITTGMEGGDEKAPRPAREGLTRCKGGWFSILGQEKNWGGGDSNHRSS